MNAVLHADRDRLVDRFLRLATLPSPTRHERGVADAVIEELSALGFETTEDDAGSRVGGDTGNLHAFIAGERHDLPTMLLSAHLDTVPVDRDIRPRVDGDVVRTDGRTILGADDKCGVAALLEALTVLHESGTPHAPLDLVFTVGEECGLDGAKAFDKTVLRAAMGFTLDHSLPTSVVRGAPAKKELRFKVRGVGGHAARPAATLNPIVAAARGIAVAPQGQIDPQSTANLGIVRGGSAVNVVPAEVEVRGEVRSHDPSRLQFLALQMQGVMEAAAEQTAAFLDGQRVCCRVETDVIDRYRAYLLDEAEEVVQRAFAAIRHCGGDPVSCIGQGGLDANIFNEAGVPTVAIGSGAHSPHTSEEYACISEMLLSVSMLCAVVAPPPSE